MSRNLFADNGEFVHGVQATVSASTVKNYLDKARRLYARCGKEIRVEQVDYRFFCAWLLSLRPKIAAATYRQYKSACVYWLWHIVGTDKARVAAVFLAGQSGNGTMKKGRKTSSRKIKYLPQELFDRVSAGLLAENPKWAREVFLFLQAGVLTGLRPSEWSEAAMDTVDGKPCLTVRNGKASNGRANGEIRGLLLHGLDDEELAIIKEHLSLIRDFKAGGGKFEKYYKNCKNTLFSFQERHKLGIRGRKISLYSCRHQFSADAKADRIEHAVLSAMMGHAATVTAQKHYGRRVNGRTGKSKVQPLPGQVAGVRHNHVSRPTYEPVAQDVQPKLR